MPANNIHDLWPTLAHLADWTARNCGLCRHCTTNPSAAPFHPHCSWAARLVSLHRINAPVSHALLATLYDTSLTEPLRQITPAPPHCRNLKSCRGRPNRPLR